MAHRAPEDKALLDAWRAGDRRAGEVLFERYYVSIARFFRNKVPDAAEELIQRTFVALVESQQRFRGRSSFRTYVFAIAHNQMRMHFRTGKRSPTRVELDLTRLSSSELCPAADTLAVNREEMRLLLEGLRRIPLAYQVVLELHYWEQYSAAQIAEVLDVPLGTIKTRLRRGRELLKERITAIAESREVLDSTLENLDSWARGLRAQIDR